MSIRKQIAAPLFFSALLTCACVPELGVAGAREEGRLLTATEVVEEVQAMPDQQIPDALLSRAYGIAVIPDVTKVATGPVGRQGSAATDMSFNAEIYSYARTRGLFGGIALDGSVISIDRSANSALYGKSGVTATDIFSGQAPAAPPTAQRFLDRLAQATHTPLRSSPAPAADVPAAAATPATTPAPTAEAPRTYPLEQQH